jgi:hypothetical protein
LNGTERIGPLALAQVSQAAYSGNLPLDGNPTS